MRENDLSREVKAIKKDLSALRHDVAGATGTVLDRGRRTTADVKHSVEDAVGSSIESARDTIEGRPFTAMLVAFGAGMVIGKLLDRH